MMRGVGLVVLTQEAVRQRSDIFHTVFELRSLLRPCLSFGQLPMSMLPLPSIYQGFRLPVVKPHKILLTRMMNQKPMKKLLKC